MKLTPTQRDAMLAEYESGEISLDVLAERWGVSLSTINTYRRRAGLSGRAVVNRNLIPVEPVNVSVHVLPVYPVRLVSRPGETCSAESARWGDRCTLPPGHPGDHVSAGGGAWQRGHLLRDGEPEGGDDGRS